MWVWEPNFGHLQEQYALVNVGSLPNPFTLELDTKNLFFFFAKFSLVHFPKLCQIYRASSQNKAIYLTLKEQVIYFLGLQVF